MRWVSGVYIGLGGNLGDPLGNLQGAILRLCEEGGLDVEGLSPFYVTEPVSPIAQPPYLNAVCRVRTLLPPQELFAVMQRIERELGKVPKRKDCPRPIDLDLLLYGEQLVEERHLQVPHPRWRERLFVLRPLQDVTATVQTPDGEEELADLIALAKKKYPYWTARFEGGG